MPHAGLFNFSLNHHRFVGFLLFFWKITPTIFVLSFYSLISDFCAFTLTSMFSKATLCLEKPRFCPHQWLIHSTSPYYERSFNYLVHFRPTPFLWPVNSSIGAVRLANTHSPKTLRLVLLKLSHDSLTSV